MKEELERINNSSLEQESGDRNNRLCEEKGSKDTMNGNCIEEMNGHLESLYDAIGPPITDPQAEAGPIDPLKIEDYASKIWQSVLTGEELINLNISDLPYLIESLLPKVGVAAVAGSSDTGKSSFLRQLAVNIVLGNESFLGFKVKAQHQSVIYVSTEDDPSAISFLLGKQYGKVISPHQLRNLRFVFDTGSIVERLEDTLDRQPADCIIVDTFTDLYGGELNAANKVRNYIHRFSRLATKFGCLVIFLHHTGKRTEVDPPSKNNLLGSQGFEAKMRLVMELRKDHINPGLRHLCIVKGNYIKDEEKSKSYVLRCDENMLYHRLPERVPFEKLKKPDPKDSGSFEMKERAADLVASGKSIREATRLLNEAGFRCGSTAVYEWTKGVRSFRYPRDWNSEQEEEEIRGIIDL